MERFGWERVYHEGLRVETTIDLDMQKAAEAEVARALADIEKRQRARGLQALGRRTRCRRRSSRSIRTPARSGAGRRPRVRREPVQPCHAGAAAAGLGVQAVRLCRGARARLHAGHADQRPERAGHDASGRLDARGRSCRRRHASRCARRCASRAIAPPCGCSRTSASRRPCEYAERFGVGRHAERAVARARLGRGDDALADVRVRRLCERGRARRADADPPRRRRATARCCTSRRPTLRSAR